MMRVSKVVRIETSRVKATGLVSRNIGFWQATMAPAQGCMQPVAFSRATPFYPLCFGVGMQAEVVVKAQEHPTLCWML